MGERTTPPRGGGAIDTSRYELRTGTLRVGDDVKSYIVAEFQELTD
jgi:hypothetical protein